MGASVQGCYLIQTMLRKGLLVLVLGVLVLELASASYTVEKLKRGQDSGYLPQEHSSGTNQYRRRQDSGYLPQNYRSGTNQYRKWYRRRSGGAGAARRRSAPTWKPDWKPATELPSKPQGGRETTPPPSKCAVGPWSEWSDLATFGCLKYLRRTRWCLKGGSGEKCAVERCHTTLVDGRPHIPKMQEQKREGERKCEHEHGVPKVPGSAVIPTTTAATWKPVTQKPSNPLGVLFSTPPPSKCALGPWSEWSKLGTFGCVNHMRRTRWCVVPGGSPRTGQKCAVERCHTTLADGRPSIPIMQEGKREGEPECEGHGQPAEPVAVATTTTTPNWSTTTTPKPTTTILGYGK